MLPQPIRVIIVDDQDMVRTALEIFFETCDDIELVGTATNAQDGILLCETLQPDVVLMDIMLDDKADGIMATRAIHQTTPAVRIVALSSFCSVELVEEAFAAGVINYLYKNMSVDELAEAIRAAYKGHVLISPQAAQIFNLSGKQLPPGVNLQQ